MKLFKICFFVFICVVLLNSCKKEEELDLSEIERQLAENEFELISKTTSKPWKGEKFIDGKLGGIWNDSIINDPKTFNQLIAERDGTSNGIIEQTLDYLSDYNTFTREWEPHAAFCEIETDPAKNTLTAHFTIRDGLFWTYPDNDKKIPVTSDDFVFWYNEIAGDPEFASSGYSGQWVTLENGEEAHIDCIKIDDKHFDFVFPRIVSDPLLATNMNLCPSFIYKPAKEKGGVEGVKNLFSINCDPKTIPSCGKWYITDYVPAQRLVFTRNPNYWEKDEKGVSIPYYEKMVYQIIGDQNTDYLLFTQGKTEAYVPRPEEYNDVVNNQGSDYTVFNAEGSMGSSMWIFNQNPVNSDQPFYDWFTKKEVRQAMSCLLNRDRIITQTYRGLAQPKYDFFPEVNPFYNPDITLQYKYDVKKAEQLLKSAGFTKKDGVFYDEKGNKLEFDLMIAASNTVVNDIAQIIADECSRAGVTVNIRQTDFQKIVEMLTSTYDWQSVIIGLGTNLFPSQGSNVWPSDGNLHAWYPLQEKPATEWEARIDELYNEGCYTNDHDAAKPIWDEYQRILLEQCPVIYLVRSRNFFAIRNKWDLSNVYYDNRNSAMTDHVFIKE
ncbi:MAG: ABC transporter substrate-binding protein [Spirochaetaceae bacterium]|nr:ABC transporter substrate-binding protein [Spirochaetaceae bacterium]